MKIIINAIFLLLLTLSISCMQTSISSSKQKKATREKSDSLISKKNNNYFNCDCDNFKYWIGGIQGYDSISNPPLILLGGCYGSQNYDIMLYRNPVLTYEEAKGDDDCKLKWNIPKVIYYAFIIGRHKSINPENEFDIWDYDFPSKVKVYFKTDKTEWLYKDTYEVKDFKELGKLKYKMIGM